MKNQVLALIMLLLVPACGTTQPSTTSNPLSTMPPTSIEARFDGEKCIFSGQTELTVGEHAILVLDDVGWRPEFCCRRYLEGKTYEDLMNLQPSPGELFERVSFVTDIELLGNVRNDLLGGRVYTYSFNIEGEYGCHFFIPAGKTKGLWGCGPITIIEAYLE